MSWGSADPALVEQILQRQSITLDFYARDPDLLAEHVGMEDNFEAGGYGERQVQELLQNAIDQLPAPGRVEFRLAGGTFYCANEGNAFTADGIRAVTGAFLSSKNDEKIGRFGLGFKSVLGVSNAPQILSQSVSFGFNEPGTANLFAALPKTPDRVPTLRVPSVVDPAAVAAEDPHVADFMEWATTIVRLPLLRGGDRIRRELERFDLKYLLFTHNLARVDVTLADIDGQLDTTAYRRSPTELPDVVQLEGRAGSTQRWRVLERQHRVSDSVAEELPGLFRRDEVTVSYALEQGPRSMSTGQFWAWFPLRDETTASGIFNAPWQVNDDRTALLAGSKLNAELLEVAAELLLSAALLESTPADPARHLDILPARGREVRSPADRYMSDRLPQLARTTALIPNAKGELATAREVEAPIVDGPQNPFAVPESMVRDWTQILPHAAVPHSSCYRTATRAARLQQLLTDEEGKPVCRPIRLDTWIERLAEQAHLEAYEAAIAIVASAHGDRTLWESVHRAKVIPLVDGSRVRAGEAGSVVFPESSEVALGDVRVVAVEVAESTTARAHLSTLGVRVASPDVLAQAAAAAASADWSDDDWDRLWKRLSAASRAGGASAIDAIVSRHIELKLPTQAGTWRVAREVCIDPQRTPGLPTRSLDDARIGRRRDLAEAAGGFDTIRLDYPTTSERVWPAYRDAMREKAAASDGGPFELKFDVVKAAGPIDILLELDELPGDQERAALVWWSQQLVEMIDDPTIGVAVTLPSGDHGTTSIPRPENWSLRRFGLLATSFGYRRAGEVAGRALTGFQRFIPVVTGPEWDVLKLPASLERLPVRVLGQFMDRSGYKFGDEEVFHELIAECARRAKLADRTAIPAVRLRTGTVELTDRALVVTASSDELEDLTYEDVFYIPDGPQGDAIRKTWSIPTAAEVVSRSIDWLVSGEPVSVRDKYPSLGELCDGLAPELEVRTCDEIVRRVSGPSGIRTTPLRCHLDGSTVFVLAELDDFSVLECVSTALSLNLRDADISRVLERDQQIRHNKHIQAVIEADALSDKLLALVGRDRLARALPDGFLQVVEQRRDPLSEAEVAELFLDTHGNDALRELTEPMRALGLEPPRTWDGSDVPEAFVRRLGFPRGFAGTRERRAGPTELIPGNVDLKPLHPFQSDLAGQIERLVAPTTPGTDHQRGLLYLPTGAGKTRVTTESLGTLLRDGRLTSPILWIAQSSELCEQAIVSWTEVWRAIGDERPLEVSRYWDHYEADESLQELQVVVATDDKLKAMLGRSENRAAHEWLRNCSVVVIDEAHRAGSPTYTEILRWLGITAGQGAKTERPLLGLTATPFRGRNEAVNEQFVTRFGRNLLNALDPEDPIGELRDMKVLARVEHQILDGIAIPDSPTQGATGRVAWNDVSREILGRIGSNLDRTQMLVDHIADQDSTWPILVFTPSVVSAHITAALLRSMGRSAEAVDGNLRPQERRRKIEDFRDAKTQVLVNCDLLTQGFDAPKVRALYIARPTFSPNRYIQMVGRGLRGPLNGGTEECLLVNVVDTFTQFDKELAYSEFDYLWRTDDRP